MIVSYWYSNFTTRLTCEVNRQRKRRKKGKPSALAMDDKASSASEMTRLSIRLRNMTILKINSATRNNEVAQIQICS
jgi:hypothetical protein